MASSASPETYLFEDKPLDDYENKMMGTLRKKFAGRDGAISDSYALMFVRGYRNEKKPEEETLKKYEEMLQTRSELKIDKILDSYPEGYEKYNEIYKIGILGNTKEGRPVYYERLGLLTPKAVNEFGYEKFKRCHIRMQEEIRVRKEILSRKMGSRIFKHVVVLDMDGFGVRCIAPKIIRKLKSLITFDSDMYPESLIRLYIVNAPWIFEKGWALIKGIIHKATQQKIRIIGKKKEKILTKLAKEIKLEEIPDFLGGGNSKALPGICSLEFKELLKEASATSKPKAGKCDSESVKPNTVSSVSSSSYSTSIEPTTPVTPGGPKK